MKRKKVWYTLFVHNVNKILNFFSLFERKLLPLKSNRKLTYLGALIYFNIVI